MNILIVDDNRDLAEGFADFLDGDGYDVSLAVTGKEALEFLQYNRVDLAFLDFKLPDMTGLEIYRHLRHTSPATKVMMMTGFRVEQLLAEASEGKPVYILRSPHQADLLSLVNELGSGDMLLLTYESKEIFSDSLETLSGSHSLSLVTDLNQVDYVDPGSTLTVFDVDEPVVSVLSQCLCLKENGISTPVVMALKEDMAGDEDVLHSVAGTGCLFKPFLPSEMKKIIERVARGE